MLTQEGIIVTICDPACGTGGMLAESQNWIRAHNEHATVKVYGQDYNPRSYAVAASDLLIKGHQDSRIEYGNTLTNDQFPDMRFDYLLANPPFGVDWKGEKKEIDRWPNFRGYNGKLPRVNDGALLFLIHMIAKFQPWQEGNRDKSGSRIAIVFNGSPLFTGGAGSGESEIRRWIIEHDWLEAIVALPEQMFYNTGIGTFVWVLSNRKEKHRKGKIQLIDARERWTPMKRSLGNKRRYLDEAAINDVTREHGALTESKTSKVFDNADFGYRRVTILRPLRLRFQITREAKERYLDTCPELLDAVLAVEEILGDEPYDDWNKVWDKVQEIVKDLPDDVEGWAKGAKGTAQKKLFREVFTEVDPEAEPVIAKHHKIERLDTRRPVPRPDPARAETRRIWMPCWACTPPARANTSNMNPTRRSRTPKISPSRKTSSAMSCARCGPTWRMPGSTAKPWTSRTTVSARWDTRSTSTASSSSTSRRVRCTRSTANWRRWSNGSWTCCGR